MKAIYAFSGDPITYGHIDVIKRASEMFDELIVGIGVNPNKKYTFSLEEREEMAREALAGIPNVKVVSFKGFLVDYAGEQCIPRIVRGVRNSKDLDDEMSLFKAGKRQNPNVDTILIPAKAELEDISSSAVKMVQLEKGWTREYVPLNVKENLEARISGQYAVGLTGEQGCGKSYVGRKLEELGKERGIPVHNIELDYIGHKILGSFDEPICKEVRKKICETFGEGVKLADGTIDRKILGEIVFNSPEQLEKLNQIMHESIMLGFKREMYGKKGLILINAALIAESDMAYLCNNNVILVDADKQSQERRLKDRKLAQNQISRRLASQHDYSKKNERLEQAIAKDRHGNIWTIDNSDNSNPESIKLLFDKMIRDVDKYGELCFTGLWERVGADATPDSEYKKLAETYLEGHRVYHSLQHIMHGIREFEKAKHLIENPDQVLFALWYHDFVMKKKSRVDVERSSQVAYNTCKTALLSDEFADNVKKLILTTRHNTDPVSNDEKFMVDIDLAVLGKSPEAFDAYERMIREEYSWAPDNEFRERRAEILQRFLDRPSIYFTEFFKEYEAQARENLARSIQNLKS